MTGFRHLALLRLRALAAGCGAFVPFPGAVDAQEATPVASDAGGGPVLLFAAPGLRRDLVETFAAEGALPAMAGVLAEGASSDGGLRPLSRPRLAPTWRRC